MMLAVCPSCRSAFPLDALLQDEAGRDLVVMLSGMAPSLVTPLMHYLGFFRPAKQQFAWGRALRLAREVLALQPCPATLLVAALQDVNRQLDAQRTGARFRPLSSHRHLRACLQAAEARQAGFQAGAGQSQEGV